MMYKYVMQQVLLQLTSTIFKITITLYYESGWITNLTLSPDYYMLFLLVEAVVLFTVNDTKQYILYLVYQ
jgi:hypothetical protein